jgi:serine/threonine-protein kinase
MPERIGPFEILETLGRGATAVYTARRAGEGEPVVALKVLPAAYGRDEAWRERFRRDVTALLGLDHPNIVRAIEYGDADGRPYLAMEYIEGQSLQALLADRKLSLTESLGVAKQVATALRAVHAAGLVHLDVNPRTVLAAGNGAVIKLADFGATRALPTSRLPGTLTQAEMSADTVHYRAPETGRHPADVDRRSDIYSLGALLYRMLTGQVPV